MKNRREVKAQLRGGERREGEIKFSFSDNGDRMPLLHLRRRRSGILHSLRTNLPLRQTTNRASPRAKLASGVTTPNVQTTYLTFVGEN